MNTRINSVQLDAFLKLTGELKKKTAGGTDVTLNAGEIELFRAALIKLTGKWLYEDYETRALAVENDVILGRRYYLNTKEKKESALGNSVIVERWFDEINEGKTAEISKQTLDDFAMVIETIKELRRQDHARLKKARKAIDPKNKSAASKETIIEARKALAEKPFQELQEIRGEAGKKGGKARTNALTAEERSAIARKGGLAKRDKEREKRKLKEKAAKKNEKKT